MTWHFPDNGDDEEEVFVISETAANLIYYSAIWFIVAGVWKTLEVMAFLGGLIKWP